MGQDNGKNNRGRRGPSHKKNKNKDQKNTPKRKTLADHIYHVGSAKQASDYVTVTNFIVNYVRRTFDKGDDIARALEDEATYDLDQFAPTLQVSDYLNEPAHWESHQPDYAAVLTNVVGAGTNANRHVTMRTLVNLAT